MTAARLARLGGRHVRAVEQGVMIRRRTGKELRRSGFDAEKKRRVLPTKQPLDFERLIGLDLRDVIDPVRHALERMLVHLAYAFKGTKALVEGDQDVVLLCILNRDRVDWLPALLQVVPEEIKQAQVTGLHRDQQYDDDGDDAHPNESAGYTVGECSILSSLSVAKP